MIATDDGVPDAILRDLRAVELRACGDINRVRPVDREAFEAAEEVQLIAHDRTANGAAPALVLRVRLGQPLLLRKEILGRQAAVLEEAERAAPHLIGAGLGHRVDDGPRRPTVLRIVLAGDDLEFLNRLNRRPRLRARALTNDVVVIVAAIEHVVVIAWILAIDADRIAAERLRAD